MYFERNLRYPLPKDVKQFLNDIYNRRSQFVHKSLLGEGALRGLGIDFSIGHGERLNLYAELGKLEELVSVTLIEWLRRV